MQKEVIFFVLALTAWSLTPTLSHAAPPDAKTLAKIQVLVKSEVERQLNGAVEPVPGSTGAKSKTLDQIENLETRAAVVSQTISYYDGLKRRKYRQHLLQFQADIVKGCCPLRSAAILDNSGWLRPGPAQDEDSGPRRKRGKGRGRNGGGAKSPPAATGTDTGI